MNDALLTAYGVDEIQEYLGFIYTDIWSIVTVFGDGLLPLLIFLVASGVAKVRFALVMGIATSFAGILVGVLKQIIQEPRPFLVTDEFIPFHLGSGFGMPSGHTATAFVTFFVISLFAKNKVILFGCTIIVLFVGLSRTYLGTHTLGQVMGGWILGLTVCGIGLLLRQYKIDRYIINNSRISIFIVAIASVLLGAILIYINSRIASDFIVPIAWLDYYDIAQATNAALYGTEQAIVKPLILFTPDQFALVGLFLGMSLSYVIFISREHQAIPNIRFNAKATLAMLIKFIAIIALTVLLKDYLYIATGLLMLLPLWITFPQFRFAESRYKV